MTDIIDIEQPEQTDQPKKTKQQELAPMRVRGDDGKFLPGMSGNYKGTAQHHLIARFGELLAEMTRPEDIAEIWLTVMIKAKKGNLAAARLIFQYTLGDPAKFIEVNYSGGVEMVWDWDRITLEPANSGDK